MDVARQGRSEKEHVNRDKFVLKRGGLLVPVDSLSDLRPSDSAHKPPSVDFASKMIAQRFGYCFKAFAAARPAGPAPINQKFSTQSFVLNAVNTYDRDFLKHDDVQ